jgi:homospermidine synthase
MVEKRCTPSIGLRLENGPDALLHPVRIYAFYACHDILLSLDEIT